MLTFFLAWNPYIALPIVGGVLLVALIWFIAVRVARHRHDKLLEKQVQEEIRPPVPQELRAEVTVIPAEEEAPTVFMPVPAAVKLMPNATLWWMVMIPIPWSLQERWQTRY